MAGIDLAYMAHNLDDHDVLSEIFKKAGEGLAPGGVQATVTSQVYVGLCLRTSTAELTAALGESAKAANRQARRLTFATWTLALATLGLFSATLILAVTS